MGVPEQSRDSKYMVFYTCIIILQTFFISISLRVSFFISFFLPAFCYALLFFEEQKKIKRNSLFKSALKRSFSKTLGNFQKIFSFSFCCLPKIFGQFPSGKKGSVQLFTQLLMIS